MHVSVHTRVPSLLIPPYFEQANLQIKVIKLKSECLLHNPLLCHREIAASLGKDLIMFLTVNPILCAVTLTTAAASGEMGTDREGGQSSPRGG